MDVSISARALPVEVRDSNIHGFGCFATQTIARGAVILEYTGQVIDEDEAVRRNDPTYSAYSEYIFQVNDTVFVDGLRGGNASRFINHSCDPNCRIQREGDHAYIVALRDIFPGEELTYDYAYDPDVRETCACAARTCRGYI